jgi:pyruvate dehydrogenase E2 component (dihydrolipoamide acetyltransferase)
MERRFELPDLGSGLQEAQILTWFVAVGDEVTGDQVLCEVETEKSVIEIPIPFSGTIVSLGADEGGIVRVGEMLVVITDEAEQPAPPGDVAPEGPAPPPQAAGAPSTPTESPPQEDPPRAMPVVRKLARQAGIDLSEITGTGADGRITRADVEAAVAARAAAPPAGKPETPAPVAVTGHPEGRREQLSVLRRTIATHMTEQWRDVPHIAGHTWIDATRLLQVRSALKERFGRMPIEALIVKAVIPALRAEPRCNAAVEGDEIVYHDRFDIAIAVDTPDGLLVPVLRGADEMILSEMARQIDDLVARAKDRKLTPVELSGGTFTISNIGALGGDYANQVLPRGTTAIISTGRVTEEAVVRNGVVGAASRMPLSATFDHRALDGGVGQRFINELRANLEEPALFLS